MTCGGNHEISDAEAWVSYNLRYPMPYRQSGSTSNTHWSADVGLVHLIGLNSYAATSATSVQNRWLKADLARVDRQTTPWIIVLVSGSERH